MQNTINLQPQACSCGKLQYTYTEARVRSKSPMRRMREGLIDLGPDLGPGGRLLAPD